MILKEFNKTPSARVRDINRMLSEQFGFTLSRTVPRKQQLERLNENAKQALVTLRSGGKKFQLDPEYVKFLCIRDLSQTMMEGGMYAESPAYMEMCEYVNETVRNLMDSGYTAEEACSETLNRYRRDERYAYDDDFVKPVVLKAAQDYMSECGSGGMDQRLAELEEDQFTSTLSAGLVRRIAEQCGIKLEGIHSLDEVEHKLEQYAQAAGKSRDAIVEFLEGLDDAQLTRGIQMFDAKVAESNKFMAARQDAIDAGKKEFEVDGEKYPVKGDADLSESESAERPYICTHFKKGRYECHAGSSYQAAKKAAEHWGLKSTAGIDTHLADVTHVATESMFDDILDDMITEDVDVEQAEVVMAVRALASDIQDQVERLGRMMNEDLPAIADQVRTEMGMDQAQSFLDTTSQLINTHLEATRAAKEGMDRAVGMLSGEEIGGLGDTDELGGLDADLDDLGLGDAGDDVADNMDALAGPEDEPLGRAAV